MRKKRKKHPGQNPDPERYERVKCKEGDYYRRKKGPVPLNEGMKRSAELTKVCSPAAKRLVSKLRPYLDGLRTGRVTVRFAGRLKKALNRKGQMDYSFFDGYDLQDEFPMNGLLDAPYQLEAGNDRVAVSIVINKHTLRRKNTLVSHYYFEAVLVWGDPAKDAALRVDSTVSALYAIGAEGADVCSLDVDLPPAGAPWMVLLKVSCLEGDELAVHPRHYGMKVVKVG